MLHDAKLSRSGRALRVQHHYFELDGVFEGPSSEGGVRRAITDPLLRRFFGARKDSALLLFGQTGTGKTFTLRETLGRVVRVFDGERVELRFLELAGKKACRDLLNAGAPVKVLSDADETVHFVGAASVEATTAADLRRALDAGLELRSSERTERNDASSRSHAVVELRRRGATFLVVDLAGSERKWETMAMRTRAANRESADINLSLMALKDCFRAQHDRLTHPGKKRKTRVPYRASTLTRVLRKCFEADDARESVAGSEKGDGVSPFSLERGSSW